MCHGEFYGMQKAWWAKEVADTQDTTDDNSKMTSSCIRMDPQSNCLCPGKEREKDLTRTREERCEEQGRGWNGELINQKMLVTSRPWPKLERAWTWVLHSRHPEEPGCWLCDSDSWCTGTEDTGSIILNTQLCGNFIYWLRKGVGADTETYRPFIKEVEQKSSGSVNSVKQKKQSRFHPPQLHAHPQSPDSLCPP